jgi:hypothetical protein
MESGLSSTIPPGNRRDRPADSSAAPMLSHGVELVAGVLATLLYSPEVSCWRDWEI